MDRDYSEGESRAIKTSRSGSQWAEEFAERSCGLPNLDANGDQAVRGAGLRRRSPAAGGACVGRAWPRTDGNAFDAALENERGPHRDAAYQNNIPGIDLGLDLVLAVVKSAAA